MSALAGLVYPDRRPGAGETLAAMQARMHRYGPHRSQGVEMDGAALGMQMFELMPEDRFDRQPLVGGGGRYLMVADLRLDNRPELAAELGLEAARVTAMADSQILMAAWERWQEGCLAHLVGPYAFAVWDMSERQLVLVRSPTSSRPLHYHVSPGRFAFASMPSGLFALPGVERRPDIDYLRDRYLYLPLRGKECPFKGIERLPTGHLLRLHPDGNLDVRRWWHLHEPEPLHLADERDYIAAFHESFSRATNDRLRSLHPVAAQLSAGLDSSSVVATAAPLLAERGKRLLALTGIPTVDVPDSTRYLGNEGDLASLTAASFTNVDHLLISARAGTVEQELSPAFIDCQHPLVNVFNYPWISAISRSARDHGASTLLNGGSGNLTISFKGGNLLYQLLQRGEWSGLWEEYKTLFSAGTRWPSLISQTLSPMLPTKLQWALNRARRRTHPNADHMRTVSPLLSEQAKAQGPHEREFTERMSFRDHRQAMQNYLDRFDPGTIQKGQLASFGIENRDPTGDTRLMNLLLSLPPTLFRKGSTTRRLLRIAFSERLPEPVLNSRRRGRQAADWPILFEKERLRFDAILEKAQGTPEVAEIFNIAHMRKMLTHPIKVDSPYEGETASLYAGGLARGMAFSDFIMRSLDRDVSL